MLNFFSFRKFPFWGKNNSLQDELDLFDANFYQDFFKFYPKLSERKSVYYFKKSNCYGVFDFETVKEILQNKEFFSSKNFEKDDKIILGSDGPKHSKSKKDLLTRISFLKPQNHLDFSEKYINQLLNYLFENVTTENMTFDVVEQVVNPFILNFILESYGILPSYPSLDLLSSEINHRKKIENINRIFQDKGLLGEIAKDSFKSGFISKDLQNLLSDFHINSIHEQDLINFLNVFIQAGVLTTSSLLVSCILKFDLLDCQKLKDDSYLNLYIDEVLRLYSPSQFVFRKVVKDFKKDKFVVPAGSLIAISIGAANRDEEVFKNPMNFELNRKEKHLAFGTSSHKCVGEKVVYTIARTFIRKFYLDFYQVKNLKVENEYTFDNSIFIYKIKNLILKSNV
jgi:cytochrome P450